MIFGSESEISTSSVRYLVSGAWGNSDFISSSLLWSFSNLSSPMYCQTESLYNIIQSLASSPCFCNLNCCSVKNCEDWYPQYQFLTEQQFRLQKHGEDASDCIMLYNDSVWQYIGEDRLEKLHNRLDEIKSELPQAH